MGSTGGAANGGYVDFDAITRIFSNPLSNSHLSDFQYSYEVVGGLLRIKMTGDYAFTTRLWTLMYYSNNSDFPVFIGGWQCEQLGKVTSLIQSNGGSTTREADIITYTPPVGTTKIIETIDGITQAPITTIPEEYTLPNGNIDKIEFLSY